MKQVDDCMMYCTVYEDTVGVKEQGDLRHQYMKRLQKEGRMKK